MAFRIHDTLSLASGDANDDRVGAWHDRAWVIDGATDIGSEPLTGTASDAGWFAGEIHDLLSSPSFPLSGDLADIPARLATEVGPRFEAVRSRNPIDRFEHPSAAGIVIRVEGRRLDYVSVGDCTLIVAQGGAAVRLGAELSDAGDRQLAAAISAFHNENSEATADSARQHVWPQIRAQRNRLNTPTGYGVFSITPPPPDFVRVGHVLLDPDALILLASDGLMRLVDVYRQMSIDRLVREVRTRGLVSVAATLRAIEADDGRNQRYPRAKTTDDASGLLLSVPT